MNVAFLVRSSESEGSLYDSLGIQCVTLHQIKDELLQCQVVINVNKCATFKTDAKRFMYNISAK